MADRKETEKGLTEQVENKVVDTEVMKQPIVEDAVKKEESEEQFSSLDLLWHHAFGELDEWEKRANLRDGLFFKAAKQFADGVQRNQGNLF